MVYLWKLPEVCIFMECVYFAKKYFFRMHLPLSIEVYNILFINSLDFMVVHETKKHLFWAHSLKYILTVALISALTNGVWAG